MVFDFTSVILRLFKDVLPGRFQWRSSVAFFNSLILRRSSKTFFRDAFNGVPQWRSSILLFWDALQRRSFRTLSMAFLCGVLQLSYSAFIQWCFSVMFFIGVCCVRSVRQLQFNNFLCNFVVRLPLFIVFWHTWVVWVLCLSLLFFCLLFWHLSSS